MKSSMTLFFYLNVDILSIWSMSPLYFKASSTAFLEPRVTVWFLTITVAVLKMDLYYLTQDIQIDFRFRPLFDNRFYLVKLYFTQQNLVKSTSVIHVYTLDSSDNTYGCAEVYKHLCTTPALWPNNHPPNIHLEH